MKDLTRGKPSALILSFALPIFLGNLLQLTYSLVDTRIVGSFLGEDALAAVGATSTLSGLIIGFLLGLSNGFAIITAQKFGAKNIADMKKSFAMSLVIGTGISILFTIAGLLFLKPILHFLNVPKHLVTVAKGYIGSTEYRGGSVLRCGIEDWRKRSSNCNCTGTDHCICDLLDLYDQKI